MDMQEEILQLKKNILLARAQKEKGAPEEQNAEAAPTKTKIIIRISPDRMEATILLHPTSPNTLPPLREELLEALEAQQITYGINMELLEDLCVKPLFYHVMVIARGQPPTIGRDGILNYLVSLTVDHRPQIGEDGIADYKNINFFRVVYKDQPLCEITPPEKGEDGMDIHGNVIAGTFGRDNLDPSGMNTVYNEDNTLLLSAIDGHVNIQYGVISVVEVLTIDASVNNSTGNIDFTGDVVVGGDVASGFAIKCGGSIAVNGSVEGAVLEAGTDINVSVGVLGMDKGQVNAGGNIKCKFIQNCTVRASGNIYADSILFSTVECGGDLILDGRKGALIGGHATVGGKVILKTIGSPMHVPTVIDIHEAPKENDSLIRELEGQVANYNDDILKIIQMMTRYEEENRKGKLNADQTKALIAATDRYRQLVKQREAAEARLAVLLEERKAADEEGSYIECKGTVHTNTRIGFGSMKLPVDRSFDRSRIQPTSEGISVILL